MTDFRHGTVPDAYSGGTVGDLHPIILFSPGGASCPAGATKLVFDCREEYTTFLNAGKEKIPGAISTGEKRNYCFFLEASRIRAA